MSGHYSPLLSQLSQIFHANINPYIIKTTFIFLSMTKLKYFYLNCKITSFDGISLSGGVCVARPGVHTDPNTPVAVTSLRSAGGRRRLHQSPPVRNRWGRLLLLHTSGPSSSGGSRGSEALCSAAAAAELLLFISPENFFTDCQL